MEFKKQIGLCLAVWSVAGCTADFAEGKRSGRDRTQATDDLELTVYKNDFALVHDVRQIKLATGASDVRLPGVSKMLDPDSVLFDWPGQGAKPDVVSTTYNLGVGSSKDLLKRLVGQKVDIVWRGQDGKVGDRATGTLEEAGDGTVLHTTDAYLVDPGGEIMAPGAQAVSTMPDLVASVNASGGGDRKVGISYLTRGLSWNADYVGVIGPDAKSMRLECWGTITNLTGTDFPHAKLRLVAGNPNRAVLNTAPTRIRLGGNANQASDMSGFA